MEEARDQGLNLAFFSGNEVYWRVRWDAGGMVLLGAEMINTEIILLGD